MYEDSREPLQGLRKPALREHDSMQICSIRSFFFFSSLSKELRAVTITTGRKQGDCCISACGYFAVEVPFPMENTFKMICLHLVDV